MDCKDCQTRCCRLNTQLTNKVTWTAQIGQTRCCRPNTQHYKQSNMDCTDRTDQMLQTEYTTLQTKQHRLHRSDRPDAVDPIHNITNKATWTAKIVRPDAFYSGLRN